jgi:hypothetical protein
MSSDDHTHNLTDSREDDMATQPTITAVFRLLRDVQDGQTSLNSRFDALESSVNSRFDALDSRLARDFAGVDSRFAEMSDEMKSGLLRLSDKLCDRIDRQRMHADADIEDITRRLRKLESKAS